MTVRIGSYTALERPDGGHRAAGSALWRGEDETGTPVCLLVLPIDDADEVRDRVAAAAVISHRHLLPVIDVVADDERIAVVSPWPRGGRLLELVRRRGTLDTGQVLTVLIPLASALAAVHRSGVRHGGVGAGSVFFDKDGRPQLGALAISSIISDCNGGLPGQSWDVAPELVRGERLHHGPMTPAADVFSLGSVALYCLTAASAWPADDPTDVLIQSTAGVWPDPPSGCAPPALLQVVRRMLLDDPTGRPAASDLVGLLAAIGAPSPVSLGAGPGPATTSPTSWHGWAQDSGSDTDGPSAESAATRNPDVAGGDEARATAAGHGSSRAQHSAVPGSRRSRSRQGPPPMRARPSTPPRILTEAPARPLMTGARLAGPTPIARAGIAALTVVLAFVVGLQIWVWSTGSEGSSAATPEPASRASPTAAPATAALATTARAATPAASIPIAEQDWRAVVTALDAARSRALSAADPALLDQVYLSGSAAAAADTATIRSLTERGWRVSGALHHIDDVTLLPVAAPSGTGTPTPDRRGTNGSSSTPAQPFGPNGGPDHYRVVEVGVRVVIRASLPPYPVLDADGRQVGMTAAHSQQQQILTIASTAAGYRISAVQVG